MRRRLLASVLELLIVGALAVTIAIGIAMLEGGKLPIHMYVREHALEQTGAINAVSAIYLNYRFFDTLGETIVLLLVVSGVLVIGVVRK